MTSINTRPSTAKTPAAKVAALSGGVGGAKLALGLYRLLPPEHLSVICNPGDDFEHLGLTICPDFDTVLYTLSGLANPELGWGRRDETWSCMRALETLGGETWFNLGDGDLALHLERTRRLNNGETATQVARDLRRHLGIQADLIPPCDEPVRTLVHTASEGTLPLQRYFVERRCEPAITGFSFQGAQAAEISPSARVALDAPDLDVILICPSNPFISIDPLLAVPGLREALVDARAPVIAVSPIICGEAVKGPTAKMMDELSLPRSNATLAAHYGEVVNGWVIDTGDADEAAELGLPYRLTETMMTDEASKIRLASACIDFARELS